MVKYAGNAYHALKITFANELGNLCKRLGLDGRSVMDIFCRDEKLNVSAGVPAARICVRRVVPSEGPTRAPVSREGARCRHAGPAVDSGQQHAPDRRGATG